MLFTLNEALWFFLFGHKFVPFGKPEFFGSGQLAFARLRRAVEPPGSLSVSRPSYPEGTPAVSGVILASALIRIGWRLQWETSEQGKPPPLPKAQGGRPARSGRGLGVETAQVSTCASRPLPYFLPASLKSANGDLGSRRWGGWPGAATLVASWCGPLRGPVVPASSAAVALAQAPLLFGS